MTDNPEDFKPDVFKCDICDFTYEHDFNERYRYEPENMNLCHDCMKEHFKRCENCGELSDRDDKLKACPKCEEAYKEEGG